MLIRPGTPRDAEAVAHVHLESWDAAYGIEGPSLERRVQLHRKLLPHVAEIDGEIVGFVSVGPAHDEDADGELYMIYALPEHWGRGVGPALIEAGEEHLRELGHETAVLWVLETNARARRFYEIAGWAPDGHERPIEIRGMSLLEIRYTKQL